MAALFTVALFLFLVMESLVGMVANGSIVLICLTDWFKSGKLSPTDLILTCLGISRLLLQAVMIPHGALLHKPALRNVLFTLIVIWTFTNTLNLWFAACLSVFYLAKIAIFSHPVFLQVKRRLPGLMPWLLLGSVISSAVTTVIVTTSWNYALSTCNPLKALLNNQSNAEGKIPKVCCHLIALNAVFDFIPFTICLSSAIFLISSLWKHMRHVQSNGSSSRDLNTQAHLSAIKALAAFTVLYMISFVAITAKSIVVWKNRYTWSTMLFNLSAMYPSGHAIILILINPKLKQAWVRMIEHLKCHLSKVPS